MMRGQTVRAVIFVAILSLLAADISVGCGKNAYVYGPVEQKYVKNRDEFDPQIMVGGQTYLVPVTFFDAISVGDTVKYNGTKWSIVKTSDGRPVPAQYAP
ncbi:MAG: hypothetical protein ACYDAB_11315 [bacterium]